MKSSVKSLRMSKDSRGMVFDLPSDLSRCGVCVCVSEHVCVCVCVCECVCVHERVCFV